MPSSGRQGVHALGPRLPYHTEARRLLAPYTLVTSDTYRLQLSPHRSPLDKNEQKLNFFLSFPTAVKVTRRIRLLGFAAVVSSTVGVPLNMG